MQLMLLIHYAGLILVVNVAFRGQFDQFPSEHAAHISAVALGCLLFHRRICMKDEIAATAL